MVIVSLFFSCDRDNNHPGYQYFPDMAQSPAYETYSENPNFADNKTMREPVEGTVPRGFHPLPYRSSIADRELAGKELTNPFEYNQENLTRGKEMYYRFCFQCHGENGDGKGHLVTSGRFPFPVRSLVNETVRDIEDGQIFHTITYGFGVMGAHGTLIPEDDRWKIILYIRQELQKERPH